jgi:catechol 2,3-dioxygenase-like lactoylglutathione lyase family enzyme
MSRPTLSGLHHLKIPVTDLSRSIDWYTRVFGLRVTMEFPDANGTVLGIVGEVPGLGDTQLTLRVNATAARGCHGFDPISYAVDDHSDVEAWAGFLDRVEVSHSPVIEASVGWLLVFDDPDGIQIHIYRRAAHGLNHSDEPGYGRHVVEAPRGVSAGRS